MKLILASASPRRRELLQQIGLDFQVIPSDCNEDCCLTIPQELVEELARQKAEYVADRVRKQIAGVQENIGVLAVSDGRSASIGKLATSDGHGMTANVVVLGSDTVVAKDGEILGKPKNTEHAYEMIQNLQGERHEVYSGVALYVLSEETGQTLLTRSFHVRTEVEVYPMTEKQIRDYIATGEPMDKAGAYGIQGKFAAYIKGITGDYYNVVGLPLSRLVQELQDICYE